MKTLTARSLLGILATVIFSVVPSAMAQPTTSIGTEYLMTVYLPKDRSVVAGSDLVISHDATGGPVKGKVSGRILEPSADWIRVIPSEGLRLRLDARVTIETDEHEIIYMSYNGRMNCDRAAADRYRKGEIVTAHDCYLISAPTFETKSGKYSWLNDVQAVGKLVEYKPGKDGHLIYDIFIVK